MKLYLGIISLLLVGCTGENVIEKQANTAPTILIVSHSNQAEILEGYAENFRASVSDDDNEFSELSVAWYVGENLVCDWAEASPAGESFCEIVFDQSDNNVVVEVRDSQGAGARDEISVVVQPTDAPVVELQYPLASGQYYSNTLVQFAAIVSDNEDDPEDLVLTWTSSLDGDLPLDGSVSSNGEMSDYYYLSEGVHVIEVQVEDSSAKISTKEVLITVGSANVPPTCGILSPQNQAAYESGESIFFEGEATDANIPATSLSALWISDKDGDLGNGVINSAGEVSFAYGDLSVNDHVITLKVTDDVGEVCQDTIFLTVGNRPSALIENPVNGDVVALHDTVIFRGQLSDTEDSAGDLQVAWTSSIDGTLHTGVATSQGISQFSTNNLSAGWHTVDMAVVDSGGLQASDVITLRVNTPPNMPTVALTPTAVYSNGILTATANSTGDADGDAVTLSYQWLENGVMTAITGSTVAAVDLDVGDVWTVRVTPNDGNHDGAFVEASITVANSLPQVSNIQVSSSNGAVYNDSILTCSGSVTDLDETVTPVFRWLVDGVGYNGAVLDLGAVTVDSNSSITCTVSVTDSNGGTASDSLSVVVNNRNPVIQSVSIAPNPIVSDALASCTALANDADADALTYTYEWMINGNSVGNASTLQLDNSIATPNDNLTCQVLVSDEFGNTASSTTTLMVQNTVPTIDMASLTPTQPSAMDVLLCEASASDIDGGMPSLSFAFSNQSTGATYTATTTTATTATFDLSSTNVSYNDVIACTITATDTDGGMVTDIQTATIFNTAPMFSQAPVITPNTGVHIATDLSCAATAYDPDGGSITYNYTWLVNGAQVAIGPNYTVSPAHASINDNIACQVTAIDSDMESMTSMSSLVFVNNAPPEITNLILNTLQPYTNDTLTVSATTLDVDGQSLSLTYAWHVVDASNGGTDSVVSFGVGTSYSSLSGSAFDRDDQVYVVATASDGLDSSAPVTTTAAVVQNSVPSTPNVAISASNTPIEGLDDLICSVSSSTDNDGDSLDYTFEWFDPNGQSQQILANSTSTTDTYVGTGTFAGMWTCEVTVSDGTDTSVDFDSIDVVPLVTDVTFTTCGQGGLSGPSQSQCNLAYTNTDLAGAVTVLGGIQQWVVPATGTYVIEAYGAQGGDGFGGAGGEGAIVSGEFALNSGDILHLLVGQRGGNATSSASGYSGGGGGGTFVVLNGSPLVVAGGGGGGGVPNSCTGSSAALIPGLPGQSTQLGIAGQGVGCTNQSTVAGYGGTGVLCSTGASAGAGFYGDSVDYSTSSWATKAYAYVNGGNGATQRTQGGSGGFGGGGGGAYGGGGGGGYSGGGTGDYKSPCRDQGGGGAGSFNSGSNPSNGTGGNQGPGWVLISWQ